MAIFAAFYAVAKYINIAMPSYITWAGLIFFCELSSQTIQNLFVIVAYRQGWDRLLD